jgi:CSLREA domain-containing protein
VCLHSKLTKEEERMIRTATILCLAFAMLAAAGTVRAATYTVTKEADTSDGLCNADCSLREAITAANATVDNDVIVFALPFFSSPRTITLSLGELTVANNGSLTIYGTGANRLTISGNNATRILSTGSGVVVNIHHIRFTGGNGAGAVNTGRGGALYNVGGTMLLTNSVLTGNTAANGGAINNAASTNPATPANLTIDNCVLSNNSSTSSGGAMQNFSTSTLHVRNTTVNNNNSGSTGIAGAFQANGMVTITNSTFSGNTSAGTGGGIYYNGTGLTMTNVTVSGNTSALGSGGFHKSTATLNANVRNSLFSGNTGAAGAGDVLGPVSSQGNNIIHVVGTSTGWIKSDQQNVNPLISPLGFHGGHGMTNALLSGSPALNTGQNCVTDLTCSAANPPVALTTDQRGALRSGNVDVGSYEETSAYTALLPSALISQPYNQVLVPNVGAFSYSVTSGSPPPGITVNTGAMIASVSGTPTQLGAFGFGVTATNGANSAVINYRLNVLNDLSVVSLRGIAVSSTGRPVYGVRVMLTDLNGNFRFSRTNPFGYFQFDNIPAGSTFLLQAASKEHSFESRTITVVDATDLALVAQP